MSVALALALGAADPGPELEAPPTATTAAGVLPRPQPPAAVDAGEAEWTATPNAALAPSISLWLLGDVGTLPRPSLGAALGAELGWRKIELRALGTLLFERETHLDAPNMPAPGAKLQLVTGGLLACAAPFGSLRDTLAPFACVGAEIIVSGGFEQPPSDDSVVIAGNDKLTSVAFGAGWGGAAAVNIANNASLTSIDLGKLRSIDSLLIGSNAALSAVRLEALQTVDSLSVHDNPLLSTSELRNVRTFESAISGNADDPPAAP